MVKTLKWGKIQRLRGYCKMDKIKYEKLNNYIYVNDDNMCMEITQQNDFIEYFDTWCDESENVPREILSTIIDKFNEYLRNNTTNIAVIIYERDENGVIDIINKMFLINPVNMDCFGIDLKNVKLMF